MIQGIEKFADIQIKNPIVTPTTLTGFCYRIQRGAPWPIPIRVFMKNWLNQWLQISLDCCLSYPVTDCRYPKLPSAPI
jgi:hypothetical protein